MYNEIQTVTLEPYIIRALDLLDLSYLGSAGKLLIDTVLVVCVSDVDIVAGNNISERYCLGGGCLRCGRSGGNGLCYGLYRCRSGRILRSASCNAAPEQYYKQKYTYDGDQYAQKPVYIDASVPGAALLAIAILLTGPEPVLSCRYLALA